MSCPSIEQLAAAASGQTLDDDALFTHLDTCVACQHALDQQNEARLLLGEAPGVPALTDHHRESLAAEVMARADVPRTAQTRWRPLAGLALAAAAVAAVAFGLRTRSHEQPVDVVAVAPTPVEVVPPPVVSVPDAAVAEPTPPTGVVVAPVAVPRAKLEGDADYARTLEGERELVKLTTGALTVDARHARPVRVVAGDTAVAVKKARIKVVADKGVISQVDVFAGSVEVTVGGKTQVIEAGEMWSPSSSADDSLVAFRKGWKALRNGDNAGAVKLFDQASDDVVAEDAMYWAAVASERNDDPTGALTRYQQLLDRFPHSTRAKEARAAIERLR
ncbi:MAG TPA: hypothetical protein VGM90_40465 [Kofleriaceae bacterium]|jgi:hypothetical protein